MKRPSAPIKPKKHEAMPSEFERRSYCIFTNDKNQIVLVNGDDANKYNEEESLLQYEVDNLDKIREITYSLVMKIKTLINETISPEINDFEIAEIFDNDGYSECLEVSFLIKKEEEKYKKEVEKHNNRFEEYNRQHEKYQKLLQTFNEQKKKEKINLLHKQIETLTGE